MRLVSFSLNHRDRYGIAIDDGVIDLTDLMGPECPDLQSFDRARRPCQSQADRRRAFCRSSARRCRVAATDHCGRKSSGASASITRIATPSIRTPSELPQYPSLFVRNMSSVVGSGQPIERAEGVRATRL